MPVLTPGTPFSSRDPLLLVENKLAAGVVTFTLTVVDQSGKVSAPAQLRVTVTPPLHQPILEPPISGTTTRIIQP